MDKFTMVFLDLDNTLIPSRMRKVIQCQLGLDIFDILSTTLLKTLQYSIIKAINKIQTVIKQQNKPVIIAIVSNGSMKWLNQCFRYSENSLTSCTFPILGKYLQQNNIAMFSAMDEMYNFLQYKYDANIASEMIKYAYTNYSTASDDQQKWMWKYTTFSSILLQYKRFRNKQCDHIISLGDGSTEAKALSSYANKFNVSCNHIKFLDCPTINQLQLQWKYVEDKFEDIICTETLSNPFELFNLREIFKCDNNKKGTGETDQIHAVFNYFEKWINSLNEKNDIKYKENNINKVAAFAQKKLANGKRKTKHLKLILKQLRYNKEFNDAFVKQVISANIKSIKCRDNINV